MKRRHNQSYYKKNRDEILKQKKEYYERKKMELKEKVRRMEEVIKLNNQYVREIWKCLKMFAKNMGANSGSIEKIVESLLENLNIDIDTGELKEKVVSTTKVKDLVGMYL